MNYTQAIDQVRDVVGAIWSRLTILFTAINGMFARKMDFPMRRM